MVWEEMRVPSRMDSTRAPRRKVALAGKTSRAMSFATSDWSLACDCDPSGELKSPSISVLPVLSSGTISPRRACDWRWGEGKRKRLGGGALAAVGKYQRRRVPSLARPGAQPLRMAESHEYTARLQLGCGRRERTSLWQSWAWRSEFPGAPRWRRYGRWRGDELPAPGRDGTSGSRCT